MDIDQYINDNLDDLISSNDYSSLDLTELCSEEISITNCKPGIPESRRIIVEEEIKEEFKNEDEDNINEYIFDKMCDGSPDNEGTEEDDDEYYCNLLNIYLKYYNDKFNKQNNFFSGIDDYTKDTTSQMELFFESIIEYKQLKKILEIESDSIAMKYFFDENKKDKIKYLFENYESQIYCLEILNNKVYSPSLIICLNYILENFNEKFTMIDWKIYNLRNL